MMVVVVVVVVLVMIVVEIEVVVLVAVAAAMGLREREQAAGTGRHDAASPGGFEKAPSPGWWCWQFTIMKRSNLRVKEAAATQKYGYTIASGASKERRGLQAYRLGALRVVATKVTVVV